MNRAAYSDDCGEDQWALIRWRGAVASAIKGKRGQAFLREMLEALDAMPEKRLIREELAKDGAVCAIGSVGAKRGVDMSALDPGDHYRLSEVFGIPNALVREIEYTNDDCWYGETPERRFDRMRKWVVDQLRSPSPT